MAWKQVRSRLSMPHTQIQPYSKQHETSGVFSRSEEDRLSFLPRRLLVAGLLVLLEKDQ